jgi:hypothetical protein
MRAVAILAASAACAGSPTGELRFRVQPPVWHVNDRVPIEKPDERIYNRTLYHTDGFFVRRATRAMDVVAPGRARDVNSLDEVPDSTWFTNRIGVRALSLDDLRRGPNTGPDPFEHRPWKIVGAKLGGTALGFRFEDSAGNKYLLKFDSRDRPELDTATHIIVHRILWACGYNVPEDRIGYIRREDLALATPKLTAAQLDAALEHVARLPDGRIRVLASRLLPGKPIGPYAREGTRPDDPNDLIPHEQRRSVRGQYAIFSWLEHTDLQEDNTLDVFVPDPGDRDRGRGHVVHYLIDFGRALGVMALVNHRPTVGHTYLLDPGMALRSLLTFGLWKRPWDELEEPGLPGVGVYDAASYRPGAWRPNSMYWPYEDKDRFDAFWGAKLAMQFTRDQLAAIVDEAHYSDPRSARYVLDTLIARQRATARYWFARVSPLDRFAVERDALCFDDLALVHGLETAATRHHAQAFDRDGRALGEPVALAAGPSGRTCVAVPPSAGDGYTIMRLAVSRDAGRLPPVVVHVARDAAGQLAVIGLRRR